MFHVTSIVIEQISDFYYTFIIDEKQESKPMMIHQNLRKRLLLKFKCKSHDFGTILIDGGHLIVGPILIMMML